MNGHVDGIQNAAYQSACKVQVENHIHIYTQTIEENLLRNVSDGYKEIFSNNCEKTTIDRIVDKYQKLKDPQLFDYYIAGKYNRLYQDSLASLVWLKVTGPIELQRFASTKFSITGELMTQMLVETVQFSIGTYLDLDENCYIRDWTFDNSFLFVGSLVRDRKSIKLG